MVTARVIRGDEVVDLLLAYDATIDCGGVNPASLKVNRTVIAQTGWATEGQTILVMPAGAVSETRRAYMRAYMRNRRAQQNAPQ